MTQISAPTKPCPTCPYRRDVPSGVWAADEYAKLPLYDLPTMEQPAGVFHCHTAPGQACAGWAGCHDGDELLALRVGVMTGSMTPETADTIRDYESPVPLFATGAEAASHGMTGIAAPGAAARAAIAKLNRNRRTR